MEVASRNGNAHSLFFGNNRIRRRFFSCFVGFETSLCVCVCIVFLRQFRHGKKNKTKNVTCHLLAPGAHALIDCKHFFFLLVLT
jgi:hypothetical protein